MILVKIETMRSQPYHVEPESGMTYAIGGEEVLDERHALANSIGGALNAVACNPAKGAIFKMTIVDPDVDEPVFDRG